MCAEDGSRFEPCVCGGQVESTRAVPPPPIDEDYAEAELEERRNRDLMVAGIVLASVGGAGLVAGGIMVGVGEASDVTTSTNPLVVESCGVDNAFERSECAALGAGIVTLGVSGGMVLGGAIMAAVGAAQVEPAETARVKAAIGPTGGSVTVKF
jgi:hypothetical protein